MARKPIPRPAHASETVSAGEAAALLGVKRASLYSYVSRGVVRSVVQPGTRARRYYREDIEGAMKRIGGRAGIPETFETAVRWGHPILATSITEVTEAGPLYRGRSAIALAQSGRSFESVAELLWSGLDLPSLGAWDGVDLPAGVVERVVALAASARAPTSLRLMGLANTVVGLTASDKTDFERGSTVTDARQLISLYAAAAGLIGGRAQRARRATEPPIATQLAQCLLAPGAKNVPAVAAAINAALIVCADHELSPSTFAARVAASTGADLRACLDAALATHSGSRLGGGCDRAEELLTAVRSVDQLRASIRSTEEAGRRLPGFNLVAYPKGDPRARFLLNLAAGFSGQTAAFKRLDALLREAESAFELLPSIEVGLVGLSIALGLPRHSASAIWAIGRSAGWVAHVIEQRLAGFMLRPRAKYVSLSPTAHG
jgi:citrate synthase